MYGREVNGKELTLGVSGMLLKNALIMYDRETQSLWKHFDGEAIEGPLKGSQLPTLRSVPRVRWDQWVKQYPKTKVLIVDGETHVARSGYDPYTRDPGRTGVIPVTNKDDRLPQKSLVLGVMAGGKAVAVPMPDLQAKGIVRFKAGGKAVVAYFDPASGQLGAVEEPEGETIVRIEERELVAKSGKRFFLVMEDGPLKFLPAVRSFWFGWADHYPKTAIAR